MVTIADGSEGVGPEIAVHTLLGDDVLQALGRKQSHGDLGRVPVAVLAAAPPWRPLAGPGSGTRRPVIALPDTGVEPHRWLDGPPDDPVVVDAAERGWLPPPDLPDSSVFRGHATFIAGVIRQLAPDCRILSVQVMGNDGTVQSADSLRALGWLAAEAESGDPDRFVDVVCVAYGYTPEQDQTGDTDETSHRKKLRAVLERLVQAGVLIVASAGNGGTDAATYPAAFAGDLALSGAVVSVGATNPDGIS